MQIGRLIYRQVVANSSKTFLTTASAFAAPDILVSKSRPNRLVCRSMYIWYFGIYVGANFSGLVNQI